MKRSAPTETLNLEGLIAASGANVAKRTDIPELDHVLAQKYPEAKQVSEDFWALANKYEYIYMCVLNFNQLMEGPNACVDFISPYEKCNKGKINSSRLERDNFAHVYNKRCLIPGNINSFSYKKVVYDHIHDDNYEVAAEFKRTCAMLKLQDCTQLLVKCGNHYHQLLFMHKSIFSTNIYKNASSNICTRRVCSSNRNGEVAGKLDAFLHLMYLCTDGKDILGWAGEDAEAFTKINLRCMQMKPSDIKNIGEDDYDDETLMQKDGNNELSFLKVSKKQKVAEMNTDDLDSLLACKSPDVGVIRNAMANSAVEKYAAMADAKSVAKSANMIEALIDANVYNHTTLLHMATRIPYLMTLYKNPQQSYVIQMMNLARCNVVNEIGVKQIIYNIYHDTDFNATAAHRNFCTMQDKHRLLMLGIALKIVHYDISSRRQNYVRVSGPPNVGKSWFIAKGLEWLCPHHSSVTVGYNTAFEYKELAQPAFFTIMDDFNTEFVKTSDVETFKKVVGGQVINVQEKGIPSTPSIPQPIIIMSNFNSYTMYGVRDPHTQTQAIRTRAWLETEINERCIDLTDVELQEMWLWLMYNLARMHMPVGFTYTRDIIDTIFKKLIVD